MQQKQNSVIDSNSFSQRKRVYIPNNWKCAKWKTALLHSALLPLALAIQIYSSVSQIATTFCAFCQRFLHASWLLEVLRNCNKYTNSICVKAEMSWITGIYLQNLMSNKIALKAFHGGWTEASLAHLTYTCESNRMNLAICPTPYSTPIVKLDLVWERAVALWDIQFNLIRCLKPKKTAQQGGTHKPECKHVRLVTSKQRILCYIMVRLFMWMMFSRSSVN